MIDQIEMQSIARMLAKKAPNNVLGNTYAPSTRGGGSPATPAASGSETPTSTRGGKMMTAEEAAKTGRVRTNEPNITASELCPEGSTWVRGSGCIKGYGEGPQKVFVGPANPYVLNENVANNPNYIQDHTYVKVGGELVPEAVYKASTQNPLAPIQAMFGDIDWKVAGAIAGGLVLVAAIKKKKEKPAKPLAKKKRLPAGKKK